MSDFDPNKINVQNGHFIDGRVIEGRKSAQLDVHRPSDNAGYAALPVADSSLVDDAVTSSRRAFKNSDWAKRSPRERARVMRRWADLLEEHREELGRIEALGSTRPIANAVGDVSFTAEAFRFFGEFADKMAGDVAATKSDSLGMTIKEPYGVVAAIAPWNFPLIIASWKIGPILAAGNAVVLKQSELTPFSIIPVAQLAIKAGMPAGIFNVIQGTGAATGDALCRHPGIGKISFTGSTATGAAIMKASAESGIKPVTLELGGKSPHLVFGDIQDLDHVAGCIARNILGNAGQVCVAGSRLIVQKSLRDPILDRLQKMMSEVVPGPTWRAKSNFSPIISATQAGKIESIVQRSKQQGAEIVMGGQRVPSIDDGYFYEPTILTSVSPDMPAVAEEIFGPVLTIESFDDDDEGIALADHPTYGLCAGVYTSNINKALHATRQLEAGTIWVNRYGRTGDFILPTGGYKSSGIGKDLGREAVEANMRSKTVLIDFTV